MRHVNKIFFVFLMTIISGCTGVNTSLKQNSVPNHKNGYILGSIVKSTWSSGSDISIVIKSTESNAAKNVYLIGNKSNGLFLTDVTPGDYSVIGVATVTGLSKSNPKEVAFGEASEINFRVEPGVVTYLGDLHLSGRMFDGRETRHLFEIHQLVDDAKRARKLLKNNYVHFVDIDVFNSAVTLTSKVNVLLPIKFQMFCNALTGCGDLERAF